MFNENQITVEKNRILKLSDAYAAMEMSQRYGVRNGEYCFSIKKNT